MKRKKRSSQEKLIIVLEGMQNRVLLGELCSRHQITQSQYYQWKDRLLKHGAHVFDFGGPDKENELLLKNTNFSSGSIFRGQVRFLFKSSNLPLNLFGCRPVRVLRG